MIRRYVAFRAGIARWLVVVAGLYPVVGRLLFELGKSVSIDGYAVCNIAQKKYWTRLNCMFHRHKLGPHPGQVVQLPHHAFVSHPTASSDISVTSSRL